MPEPADSNFCRRQAEDCKRLAQNLPDASASEMFAEMAKGWLELAAKIDQTTLMVDELDAIGRQESDDLAEEQQIASSGG